MLLRPLAIIASFVGLTGAVVGGVGLLDQLFESSGMPGWQIAWDRAEALDLEQTDEGITITLERAYADLNQALVGFTVEGLNAPPSGDGQRISLNWIAELRDPTGRTTEQWATSATGLGQDETNLSAIIQTWEGEVAPVAGTWELTLTSVGYDDGFVPDECNAGSTDPACVRPAANPMVDGIWRFAFDLPEPMGTVLKVDAAATEEHVTLRLTELRITPSRITAKIGMAVDDDAVAYWNQPHPSMRHGTTPYVVNADRFILDDEPGTAAELELQTTAGADEAAGTWEIVIPSLVYGGTADEAINVTGPWTLSVTVP